MKFKSNEEGRCPICNSQMIEYFGMELEDTAVYFPWHCPDCDTDGKEWYYVNFSEVRSNDDKIGNEEGICPDCGAEIEYDTAEPDGNSLGYEYFCPECENSGREWYDLDFDSHTIDGHEDEEIELIQEGINYKDDKLNVTTAEDPEDDRAYYGKNMTKRDKVRSLDQAKRNLDRMEKDPRVTQGQAVDQLSFDSALDTDFAYYKHNKDMAKIDKEKGNDFWADEHNRTAKQFADKIRAKHKKQEINEGLDVNNFQNKPVKAVEVTLGDKSMLFNTANVRGVFVDARQFMIPFANKLNLEVEDVKNINMNIVYEDGDKAKVRIKPFDYQDTAYERYKAFGGNEVFGQFQDWYSFDGYDEYGNKVRRKKHSKLNGYANDGSQKRLSVETKKQEEKDDRDIENLKQNIANKVADDMVKAIGADNATGMDRQNFYNNTIKSLETEKGINNILNDYKEGTSNRDIRITTDLNTLKNKLSKSKKQEVVSKDVDIIWTNGFTLDKLKDDIKNNFDDIKETIDICDVEDREQGTSVYLAKYEGNLYLTLSKHNKDDYDDDFENTATVYVNKDKIANSNEAEFKKYILYLYNYLLGLDKPIKLGESSEDIEDNDINLEDTISLLDIALKEIPTIGVEDWGKDDELLFTADTKVMFENLKNYEEEIPKYYYDNASNDDWSNGIDSYLEEIKGVNLTNGDSDNTYNWNAPLTHDVEFTIYEADDGCYFKGSIHRAGDVRGNYTTEFLLKFDSKDDCLETLFDTCSENCYRKVTVDGVDYTVSPHFFNEYVDIWNNETQESYDDVYCDCIDKLKEIIAGNTDDEPTQY